ncbi:MAG: hypothetical protein IPJ17_10255 [Holophagales bacterium]|nr:MAG: hypothetical protein IPJ17_10255 [Holophagales bacterium]
MGTLGMLLSIVGGIGMLIFGIQILILAFKKSIGWGLASLLIPFVIFFFVAQNWEACKTPFMRWAMCLPVWAIGAALSFFGAVSAAG